MMGKIIIYLLFFFPFYSYAQNAESLLNNVQEKFNSLISLQADYNSRINSGNSNFILNGTIIYLKGNKFRLVLKDKTIISDGKTVWNFDEKENRVIVSDFEDDQSNPSLEKYIFDYPSKCSVEICNKTSNCFKLTPNDLTLPFKNIKVYISYDYLITGFELIDYSNTELIVSFSNIKIDVTVNDNEFTFQPASGVKVIDLR